MLFLDFPAYLLYTHGANLYGAMRVVRTVWPYMMRGMVLALAAAAAAYITTTDFLQLVGILVR
jgi:N-acyl-L-homoserine lactone synthetase